MFSIHIFIFTSGFPLVFYLLTLVELKYSDHGHKETALPKFVLHYCHFVREIQSGCNSLPYRRRFHSFRFADFKQQNSRFTVL
jgi:hypothetical protein